jgi:hypothetical protein
MTSEQIDAIFEHAFSQLIREINSDSTTQQKQLGSNCQSMSTPEDPNSLKLTSATKISEIQFVLTPKELIYGLSSNVTERQFRTLSHSASVILNPNFHFGKLTSSRIQRNPRHVPESGY